jgi:hypothetical protein
MKKSPPRRTLASHDKIEQPAFVDQTDDQFFGGRVLGSRSLGAVGWASYLIAFVFMGRLYISIPALLLAVTLQIIFYREKRANKKAIESDLIRQQN